MRDSCLAACLRQKGTRQMQKKDQITQDADYQTALLEYRQACQHYQGSDFTKSQRDIIDTLLARKDESEFEHVANAYMAGLLDGYRILRNFGLTLE